MKKLESEDVSPRRTGAGFDRGSSKQDYATPASFLAAVRKRFLGGREFDLDLAADAGNHVCPTWCGPGGIVEDSLQAEWPHSGNLWLNPPFGDIAPWVRKCRTHCGGSAGSVRIFLLVPASVGSGWFAEHVYPAARVHALTGRLSFDGKGPYPKDCMLCVYGNSSGFEVWDWRKP